MLKIGEVEIGVTKEAVSHSSRPRILPANQGKNATGLVVGKIPLLRDYLYCVERVPNDVLLLKYDDRSLNNRLLLAPTNYSLFYNQRYGGTIYSKHVWRDFYYAITWEAFRIADTTWGATEVELNHIYGVCRWPKEMLGCQLEAVNNLQKQPPLHLRRIYLSCAASISDKMIIEESNGPFEPPRPVKAQVVSCIEYGLAPHPAIELTKVFVPNNLQNTTSHDRIG